VLLRSLKSYTVTARKPARLNQPCDAIWKGRQTKQVVDPGPAEAHFIGDIFPSCFIISCFSQLVQPAQRPALFNVRQARTQYIFRELRRLDVLVGNFSYTGRDTHLPGEARGTPAPLACHQAVRLAGRDRGTYQDGLKDTAAGDVVRQDV